MPKKLYEYDKEELENCRCYLTHKGAVSSFACYSSIKKWSEKYHKRTMEARELVEKFHIYCIYGWGSSIVNFSADCPVRVDCNVCNQKLNTKDKQSLVLFVRAVIRNLCEKRDNNKGI